MEKENIICPICHKIINSCVTCPIYKKNICTEHCEDGTVEPGEDGCCRYHMILTPASNRTCNKKRAPVSAGAQDV